MVFDINDMKKFKADLDTRIWWLQDMEPAKDSPLHRDWELEIQMWSDIYNTINVYEQATGTKL